MASTLPRVSRINDGMKAMPMASMALVMPGPSTAMIASASRMSGKESSTSVSQELPASSQPP
jgi:hypothetical protein